MPQRCPSCGQESPDPFRFCGYCGAPLDQPAKPPDAEEDSRRVVTVLFADLVDYTRASSRSDPEEIYLTIRQLFEQLAEPIGRHGGHIDRYMGDGFLAFFGLPEVHEDDPVRALRAALDMQQLMQDARADLSPGVNWELRLRVGVNTGQVIHGQISTGSMLDSSVFGHTVNLSHRLQEAARPGTVLVSEATHRLTHGLFDFMEPTRLELRSIDRPVIAYEVVAPRAQVLPMRGIIGRRTQLVGRKNEFETLFSHLQALPVEQRGMLALVSGPPGIGKTRLAEDVLSPLGSQLAVIRAGCTQTEAVSFGLLTSILENLAGILPDDPRHVRRQRIDALLSASPTLAGEIDTSLHDLLGASETHRPVVEDPQQRQRRILAAVRRLFAWQARRQPMLLVLDDLQWADPSSLVALAHVSDLVGEVPLAVIGITRESARDELAEQLSTPNLVDVHLEPLTPEESAHLVALLLPQVSIPVGLQRMIVTRGEGNPLLIEELIRMLLDRGVVRAGPGGWQVESRWPEVIQAVPDTVYGLILSRYDRLPAGLRQVLSTAAVLGQRFSLSLLAAMTHQPRADLRHQLSELEEADFVQRVSGASEASYFFRHALMQEAIYQTILKRERLALHENAAQAIREMADELAVNLPALIAHHLERAESPDAYVYLMQAARQAADRYANQESIAFYQRARTALPPEPTQAQEVDVALGLAEMLLRTNQLQEAHDTLHRARTRAGQPPDVDYRLGDIWYLLGQVQAAQGDYSEAIQALAGAGDRLLLHDGAYNQSDVEREIGWVLCRLGKLEEAQEHAETALQLAQQDKDLTLIASAYNLLTPIHYWAGRWQAASTSATEALKIREQAGDIWGAASTQANLAILYHRLGQWDRAESLLRQALFVQQEIGDHPGFVLSSNVLGLLLLETGRFDEAMDSLNTAMALLERREVAPYLASQLYGNRGLLWLRLNNPDAARADLERCLDASEQAGNDDLQALALAYLAEAQLASGRHDPARELLAQSNSLAGEDGTPEICAEILRVESLVLTHERDWGAALTANHEAQALYEEIGNRYEVAHLKLEAADLALQQEKSEPEWHLEHLDAARREAEESLQLFRELRLPVLTRRAEKLVAQINAHGAPAQAADAALTSTPVVIARFALRLPPPEERTPQTLASLTRIMAELRRSSQDEGVAITSVGEDLAFLIEALAPNDKTEAARRAVRSARSALQIVARLNRISRQQQEDTFPLAIGLAAGEWRGSLLDDEQAARYAGQSPAGILAAQLAGLAPDNQVLLDAELENWLAESVPLEPIRPEELDETLGPVYRLLAENRSQVLPGSSRELVGRRQEIGSLRDLVDRSRSESHGFVAYLEARAGMGKSRLVEEVLRYARPELRCMQTKCELFRANMSYWPLIDMLSQADLPPGRASHRLQSLLALALPDDADEALLRHSTPAQLQQEIQARTRELFIELAAQRPLLLVFEDIHAIDLSSIDLLDYLLPLTQTDRISMLLVARAEAPGPHRALVSRAERVCRNHYTRINFDNLSEGESYALLQNLMETPAVPADLWRLMQIHAGHPLSLEEALRYLVERGFLQRSHQRWEMTADIQRMPRTFRDLVLERLDALDKETLHVFQAAAVLGETFDRVLLGEIVPGPTLGARLAELVDRGWLVPAAIGEPNLYRFKHTLTRETVYDTLMASKRQVLHQRAGEALERLYPEAEEEHVELLAHHFSHSSLREKALHYLVRAAEKSAARHALNESLRFYNQAQDILQQLPSPQARLLTRVKLGLTDLYLARGEPVSALSRVRNLLEQPDLNLTAEMRAAALRHQAIAHRTMGEFPLALQRFQEALDILKPELEDAPPESIREERWQIELGVAQTYFEMRQNRRARQNGEQLLEELDPRQHAGLTASVLTLLGGIAYRQGDLETAADKVRQSLAINQQVGNRSGAASDYANLGVLEANNRDMERAYDHFSMALDLHRALGNNRGVAISYNNLGQFERNRGHFAQAAAHLQAASEAAGRADLTQILVQSLANLGQVQTLAGEHQAALRTLDEAEQLCETYGFRNLCCEITWKQAECLLEMNRPEDGAETAEAALAQAHSLNSSDLESEANRVLARIHRALGDHKSALLYSAAAWQARSNEPDPVMRARFAAERALCLLANGQEEEAQPLLVAFVAKANLAESPGFMTEIENALAALPAT